MIIFLGYTGASKINRREYSGEIYFMKIKTQMMFGWFTIILLSIITITSSAFIAIRIPSENYLPVVSLIGSTANILAVVWFTATLIYQSRQLSEQRQQFSITIEQSKRDSQRNALVVADGILREAEKVALSQNEDLKTFADLIPIYVKWDRLSIMINSSDPNEIIKAGKEWLKREGPAITITNGIKTAIKIYAESTSNNSFDFTLDADEFIYIYGPEIWQLPYFQRYQGTIQLLIEFMIRITPGRKAALLSYTIAIGLSTSENILQKNKIREDIDFLNKKNYPIPEIAKGF